MRVLIGDEESELLCLELLCEVAILSAAILLQLGTRSLVHNAKVKCSQEGS